MSSFSERMGVKPVKSVLQLGSMDEDLRNGLWNACYDFYLKKQLLEIYYRDTVTDTVIIRLWRDFFKRRIDELPTGRDTFKFIKHWFMGSVWSEVYDFVEFFVCRIGDKRFKDHCNFILQRELSGYRIVGNQLVAITMPEELAEIERAERISAPLQNASAHIRRAVDLFSDRKSPDYRNSIKESISSVEAICKFITADEKATLNTTLRQLEKAGIQLHPALKQAFEKLYAYTGDADGIRHALLAETDLDFDDAKYMLVSCSAFVNYLSAKAVKAGAIIKS